MTSSRTRLWIGTALAALALLAHARCLEVPFVYDDLRTVVGNPSLRPPVDVGFVLGYERFRPLTNVTYAVDHALWGLQPNGYHLTGLLLHALNVGLAFRWLVGLRRGVAVAAAGAALFAVHPALTQGVGYVSGRAELLCASGLLVALIAHERLAVTGDRRWAAGVLGAWSLALAAKETAAVLPILLLAADALAPVHLDPRRAAWRRRLHLALLVVVAIAGAARCASLVVEGTGLPFDAEHVARLPLVLWRYLGLIVAPFDQAIVHDVPVVTGASVCAGTLGLAGVAALAWRARRPAPLFTLGVAWFVVALLPATVVPLKEPVAEQRLYAASLGALLALSAVIVHLLARRATRTILVAALIATLSTLTSARYQVWRDVIALWTEAIDRAPTVAVAWNNRGVTSYLLGDEEAALADFERAIDLAPGDVDAVTNRANIHASRGDLARALHDLDQTLDVAPTHVPARVVRSRVRGLAGDLEGALADASRALELDPWCVDALTNRATARRMLGRHAEALVDYEAALRLAPGFPPALRGRSLSRAILGLTD